MPNKENIDAFWDIEDLIPQRPKKNIIKPAHTDTSAEEIVLTSSREKDGEPIPARTHGLAQKEEKLKVIREYSPADSLIRNVRILPWPTEFAFYTKFRKDALRYFELTHEPCEYAYFFSYMPQYEQMTISQMSYYLYWRAEARKENFLKTDINYLFLYVYEIINLPEKIPACEGALHLTRLWKTYRREFLYLDKYLGEWLCDYCLIHGVSPDWEVLKEFSGEIAGKVSIPEFYMKDGLLSWGLIFSVSSYDYTGSKYYEQYAAEYDQHIPAAVEAAVNCIIMKDPEAFGIMPVKTVRDSYSGALASHKAKYKIEISRLAIRRSASKGESDWKQIFGGLIKLTENRIRLHFGIKSRFSPTGIDSRLKDKIKAYFDAVYPDQSSKKSKKTEEDAYMALYEPKQTGKADIARALAIEEQAWETAELLSTEEDKEELSLELPEIAEPPLKAAFEENPLQKEQEEKNAFLDVFSFEEGDICGLSEDFDFIRTDLTEEQRGALRAAIQGGFAEYCREIGKMEALVRGELNEIAMEAIGDMILEEDFSPVSDYLEEMKAALSADE